MNTPEPGEIASAPSETVSEDSEPTSVTESIKSLFKKHKKIIVGSGVALVAVTGAFIGLKDQEGVTGRTEDFEPSPDLVTSDGSKRQSPSPHTVNEHQRRTKNGPITISRYSRGGSLV